MVSSSGSKCVRLRERDNCIPKYHVVFVSGDAGGQLGLVLGASVVTILEFVDLLIFLAINWFRSKP